MPTIMAGVNQTLMLAMSMVAIASNDSRWWFRPALRGIGRLDMGWSVGCAGIVIRDYSDRLTQPLGQNSRLKGTDAGI